MGVIKRIENLFEIKCSVSEETLYIPSGDDGEGQDEASNNSEQDEGEINYRQFITKRAIKNSLKLARHHPPTIGPSFSTLKSHSGRKKYRRYVMANQLLTLKEEDESQEVTIEDFIVNSKSTFSLLMEDENSLDKWNKFIACSEERQREILDGDRKKKNYSHQPVINRALRGLLKKKNLPLGMVDYLEQELISFFAAEPTKIYISPALSSFERLLLHSISNYHHLTSLSFVSGPEKVKLVRVKNPRDEFSLPSLPLIQYLKSNYNLH